ncbi:hypothetical protein ACFOHY_11120 [Rhizobium rosettiformans]|uniref:hypothetical protein n=1 Tax=Rhizobium rosettiformans TaxID=1368430 RepID=UPI003614C26C
MRSKTCQLRDMEVVHCQLARSNPCRSKTGTAVDGPHLAILHDHALRPQNTSLVRINPQ